MSKKQATIQDIAKALNITAYCLKGSERPP